MSAADLHGSDSRPNQSHVHGHEETHGGDGHHDGDELPHANLRDYLIGFVLSVFLTAIPFWLVIGEVFADKRITTAIIVVFAIAQMLVHIVYFLHLDTRSQAGWNMLAAIFTIVLVVIAISGSLWVMYHMNANMMPMDEQEMRNQP